jgi:hypothetical protein
VRGAVAVTTEAQARALTVAAAARLSEGGKRNPGESSMNFFAGNYVRGY